MIIDELYEQTYEVTSSAAPTITIQSIPIETVNFTNAYWLGWIDRTKNDIFAYHTTVFKREVITDGENLDYLFTFEDITPANENYDFTYVFENSYNRDTSPDNYWYSENDEKWLSKITQLGSNGGASFFNKMEYQAFSMHEVMLKIISFRYRTNLDYYYEYDNHISITDFYNFIKNGSSINITIAGNTYTVSLSDFNDNGLVTYVENDVEYKMFIGGYEFISHEMRGSAYNRYFSYSGGFHTKFIVNNNVVDGFHTENRNPSSPIRKSSILDGGTFNGNFSNLSNFATELTNQYNSPIRLDGIKGEFKLSDLTSADSLKGYYFGNAGIGFSFGSGVSGMFYNIFRIYKPNEIYKLASLFRWCNSYSNSTGYSNNVIYYPSVDLQTNEFLCDLITGDESYVKPRIPDWMKYDIQENTYTENDKPKPSQDDDTEANPDIETGDIVSNNFTRPFSIANQFVTSYIMTPAQVTNLGRVLWTSFNDETVTMDMVENFWANVQQATGTWDISAVMNFFISLTMFPFSIANLVSPTSLQRTDKLYVGTGKLGLDISGTNNLYVANYSVGIADFGTIDIPETYGDYRDYVNTVISVYLPYCGTVQLNPADVMGKSISCKYAVDINSGECTAFLIMVDNNVERYNLTIEKGMCGFSIPLTSTNSAQVRTRLENNMLKSGSAILSMLQNGLNVFDTVSTGNATDILASAIGFQQSVNASKMIENSFQSQSGIGCNFIGGATGFTDLASPSRAYVQIKHGIYSKPMHYKSTSAYPSNAKQYGKIDDFNGYIKCVNIDVSGLNCTEEEKSKIKALLEDGVYV